VTDERRSSYNSNKSLIKRELHINNSNNNKICTAIIIFMSPNVVPTAQLSLSFSSHVLDKYNLNSSLDIQLVVFKVTKSEKFAYEMF
jgi:predicted nucleotidyltransferase